MRQEQGRDHNAANQVAHDQLQEDKGPGKRNGRSTNDGQGTGFSRNNGEGNGPPRGTASTQKVVFDGRIPLFETGPKPGYEDQIANDHRQIGYAHGFTKCVFLQVKTGG